MKTLYLVRHGTVHNPQGITYRRLPGFHLSELGILEAQQAAEFLRDEPIEIIWHSPMERAVETAEAIARFHDAPLRVEERINEWADGESPDEVLARMWSFYENWRLSPYQVSAAVSHRDPIRRLVIEIAPAIDWPDPDDPAVYNLQPAGIYRLTESPAGVVVDDVFAAGRPTGGRRGE